ncbi:MAG TPA: DUF2059 domain-containing protein [Xanthobacteraceae bacterium]|jgi:hypothetical protein
MFSRTIKEALRVVSLGVALAFCSSIASAQHPSPTALAAAQELLIVKGVKTLYEPLVSGVIEKAKMMLLQTNPMLSKDLNDVAAKLRNDLNPRSAEVLAETARLYAAHFTEQELKDALAFYKSPLGHKLLIQEPAIADESMRSAASWADKLSEEVMNKMRTEMKKRGHDI